jgi:hypothetical protein
MVSRNKDEHDDCFFAVRDDGTINWSEGSESTNGTPEKMEKFPL